MNMINKIKMIIQKNMINKNNKYKKRQKTYLIYCLKIKNSKTNIRNILKIKLKIYLCVKI